MACHFCRPCPCGPPRRAMDQIGSDRSSPRLRTATSAPGSLGCLHVAGPKCEAGRRFWAPPRDPASTS
eukprot:12520926-Alexandrium_andersonii.AAC.1